MIENKKDLEELKNDKNKVIIIGGPTAVGKTSVSISLAKLLDGEIVSADSMQIYEHMDIGSAKPTEEEMEGIPHHMIGIVSPLDDFSVMDYSRLAKEAIRDIISRGKTPIVVGGTGLYINSLIYDMDFGETERDDVYREKLREICDENGMEHLHNLLVEIDPEAASRIHMNNTRKIIRALEVNKLTGKNMKDFVTEPKLNEEFEYVLFGLNLNRMKLYAQINKRVEIMFEMGLLDEIKKLKEMNLDGSFTSMQGIGYKEVLFYLDDKIDYDAMVSMIKQNSRTYTKRQLTWFRRYKELIIWIDRTIDEPHDQLIERILSKI